VPLNRKFLQAQADAAAARHARIEELERDIATLNAALYDWEQAQPIVQRLFEMETSALEAMLSSPPDEMISARERVKVIRELLAERTRLARTLDEKRTLLKEVLAEEM
jgi:hypothetical protein